MKCAVVLSVMHTGTHFTINLLRQHGVKTTASHFFNVHYPQHSIDGMLVVSPVRKPESVYISWFSRGLNIFYFDHYWQMFNDFYINNKCVLLPVDSNDREEYLSNLSKEIGVELKTDWEPLNSAARFNCKVPSLEHLYKLEVVRKIYGYS